jgi:hypothetical protein
MCYLHRVFLQCVIEQHCHVVVELVYCSVSGLKSLSQQFEFLQDERDMLVGQCSALISMRLIGCSDHVQPGLHLDLGLIQLIKNTTP